MAPLSFGTKADAYLEWAVHTEFAHFGSVMPAPDDRAVGLLVAWEGNAPSPAALAVVDHCASMAGVYRTQRVASITVTLAKLRQLLAAEGIARVELATPVSTDSGNRDKSHMHNAGWEAFTPSARDVLLGCIDDGFPVANRHFFDAALHRTRIARFWNQEVSPTAQGKPPGTWADDPDGTNFGYGSELIPSTPTSTRAKADLPGPSHTLDDHRFYQQRQLRRSLHWATHGAHVLDLLAGPMPVRSRIAGSRDKVAGEDGSATKPPSRADERRSTAATAPLVLVQLPQYALNDPSGRWLGHNALDGLHYIVETAKLWDAAESATAAAIKKVVVNLSWGPQTGPHDGSSLLEQAFADVVNQGAARGCMVEIMVPAGNSHESRAHAQFEAKQGTTHLCWRVPPAGESPAFLEVWWPSGTPPEAAQLTVTAPDGSTLTSTGTGFWSDGTGIHTRWGITQVQQGGNVMALIALAPTGPRQIASVAAPHGSWDIAISATSAAEANLVHVYVARASHNMGSARQARTSYLRDPVYETMRRGKEAERTHHVAGSLVQKEGSLNGLGTTQSVHMAAGYRLSDGEPARYSSSGPSRGPRDAPDDAYPTEVSRMVAGAPAGGTRAGTVVRLSGTSSAAPQMGRVAANTPGPTRPVSRPGTTPDPQLGHGRR